MKHLFYVLGGLLILGFFSGCATIVGGSKYNAKVRVPDHPEAEIKYEGSYKGKGEANFKAKRRDADDFTVTIEKEDCKSKTRRFSQRSFRGWSFFGTLVGWTGFIPGTTIPLPTGFIVDMATGALWKPDISEKGVSKQDYDNFIYTVNYEGCETTEAKENKKSKDDRTQAEKLRELKKLLDEGIITKEEFKEQKKEILDNE
jgi:hypothetical protein